MVFLEVLLAALCLGGTGIFMTIGVYSQLMLGRNLKQLARDQFVSVDIRNQALQVESRPFREKARWLKKHNMEFSEKWRIIMTKYLRLLFFSYISAGISVVSFFIGVILFA